MAVVPKNFVIKQGLTVEGTSGTIAGSAILTKSTADQNYIIGLIGGSATALATPDTVVLRDENGSFAANVVTLQQVSAINAEITTLELQSGGSISGGGSFGNIWSGGTFTGDLTGSVTGNVTGNVTGDLTGDVTGNLTGNVTGNVVGDLTGDVTGNVTGNVKDADGNIVVSVGTTLTATDFTGNLTGDVTGNLTGDVTGDVTGTVSDISNHTTTGLAEGTNLYFTDARAQDALSAGNGIIYNGSSAGGSIEVDTDVIATKVYVDSVAQGLDIKESVRVASTSSFSLPEDGYTIDGVTLATGDRVLLKSQSSAAENGIYVAAVSGNKATLTRATDADEPAELNAGTFVFVEEGTTYGDTGWVVSSDNPLVIGTDAMNWTQFSGAGTYLAGNGLTLTGNEFTIDATVVATQQDVLDLAADITALEGSLTGDYATIQYVNDEDDATLSSAQTYTDDAISTLTTGITGGTQTNISVTYSPVTGNFDFVAENGVADSTTDDLAEGAINLYYTDERAIGAFTGVAPITLDVDGNIGLDSGNGLEVNALDTLVVKAGDGITVDANGVAVDSTVTRENSDANLTSVTLDGASKIASASGDVTAATYLMLAVASADYNTFKVVYRGYHGGVGTTAGEALVVVNGTNAYVTEYGTVYDGEIPGGNLAVEVIGSDVFFGWITNDSAGTYTNNATITVTAI